MVRSDKFEPHPVSGEVEVDWDSEVVIRYRRLDEETLQALVSLQDFDLNVQLVWCTGDQEGGGDGWRIGEVSVLDTAADEQWGVNNLGEAEATFKNIKTKTAVPARSSEATKDHKSNGSSNSWQLIEDEDENEGEDDDAYWAQYDTTPARTPAVKRSPAPEAMQNIGAGRTLSEEDAYYAQYSAVQPAMDNHDPDEAEQHGEIESTLGRDDIARELHEGLHSHPEFAEAANAWNEGGGLGRPPPYEYDTPEIGHGRGEEDEEDLRDLIQQPRPASSSGSSGEVTVAKLEKTAEKQGMSEIGIKQHVSTSIKSLYRLARAAGIERDEFERLVRTELDVLGLMEEDE